MRTRLNDAIPNELFSALLNLSPQPGPGQAQVFIDSRFGLPQRFRVRVNGFGRDSKAPVGDLKVGGGSDRFHAELPKQRHRARHMGGRGDEKKWLAANGRLE